MKKFAILALIAMVSASGTVEPGSDCTAHEDCNASNACCGEAYDGATNVCSGANEADPNGDPSFTCNVYPAPNDGGGDSGANMIVPTTLSLMLASLYYVA